MFIPSNPAPCEEIHDSLLKEKKIRLWIKREDQLHPRISGNKWRKLKYNFLQAERTGNDTILTFGGAFSNHIYATAAAAIELGFKSIGIIRGEEHVPLNPTLKFAVQQGMRLIYMDRDTYRRKSGDEVLLQLRKKFGRFYLVPEGGTNALAIKGCNEITGEIIQDYDYICCSVGTGATVAGILSSIEDPTKCVMGFAALKGDFLESEIRRLLSKYRLHHSDNWKIINEYHFNGYAKISPELIYFIKDFEEKHKVLLDPVYTGKMIFGLMDLISKNYFPRGSKITALHTGGLQGWSGIIERFKNKPGYDFLFTHPYLV